MLEQTISWISIIKGAILITTLIGAAYGIIIAYRKERAKFATMEYVKKENKRIEKETAFMIESVKEAQEERTAMLETMAKRIEFIYQKHYKP